MQEMNIGRNQAGQRLDKFLHKCLPEAGNSFIYKMLRKKNITLNGGRAKGRELLQEGDVVRTYFSEETYLKFSGGPGQDCPNRRHTIVSPGQSDYLRAYRTLTGITVIHEDEDMVILNKPAGILTQKAQNTDLSLNEWLIGYLLETGSVTAEELRTFKPSVCNRLDCNTSGLVLCGKTLAGLQNLSEMFRARRLSKFYLAICVGEIREELNLTGYLHKDLRANRVELLPHPGDGRAAIQTVCRPVAAKGGYTLLEAELITGKTHQIRAHMAGIGHPVVGDYKYGDASVNKRLRAEYGLKHQLLHAYRVIFPDGREFEAPCPELFERLAQGLGLS